MSKSPQGTPQPSNQSLPAKDYGISEADIEALVRAASEVREQAYVPYSHFPVGAALLADDGSVYAGCNVENAAYGLTICAERNAVFHAVAEGSRRFSAVAVVTENGVTPCGSCRQVLAEFNPDMIVIVADTLGRRRIHSLAHLLPDAFGPSGLPDAAK